MNRLWIALFAAVAWCAAVEAAPRTESAPAEIAPIGGTPESLYDLLNLDHPGLKAVKKAWNKGDRAAADQELLKYFRSRKGISIRNLDGRGAIQLSKEDEMMANESLEHRFYAHKGYQPSYFYGEDIDWRYWPVHDNELRWQLHRHYWFIPLAKAWVVTHDRKYVDAWIEHYTDWIRKNPQDGVARLKAAGASAEEIAAEKENVRFAWRPMEAGRRLQDQLYVFDYTIDAPSFTADYLNLFLRMFHQHAEFVGSHYSKQGNHLLFEAQRMLFAGIYFPEFRQAAQWRTSGIEILNREIGVQVYPDGMQFELDYGYHLASIDIFLKALNMARSNGFEKEFPADYVETVEKMVVVAYNMLYPDYSNPMFGDTKQHSATALRRQMSSWYRVFPHNRELLWFATNYKEGEKPDYTSRQFPVSGYYVLRNGWDKEATVAVVKAGPPAFWHNQPDNGTFEYWHKGRNFFPDSGCYIYGGDKEVQALRDWFRQTRAHNTLTLDNRNLEQTDSKQLLWDSYDGQTTLVTENASYEGLTHRRAFFYMDNGVLVIVDRATGAAAGKVGVHFHLASVKLSYAEDGVRTFFPSGSNIRVKSFCNQPMKLTKEEGWVSFAYRKRQERPSYALETEKTADQEVLFVTVIAPDVKNTPADIRIDPVQESTDKSLKCTVHVNGKKYDLGYEL